MAPLEYVRATDVDDAAATVRRLGSQSLGRFELREQRFDFSVAVLEPCRIEELNVESHGRGPTSRHLGSDQSRSEAADPTVTHTEDCHSHTHVPCR
jgi:hypothetical protein